VSVRVQRLNDIAIVFELMGLASTLLGIYLATQSTQAALGIAFVAIGLLAFIGGAVTVDGKSLCSGCGDGIDRTATVCPTCKELIEEPPARY
jgi:hypothetical protein